MHAEDLILLIIKKVGLFPTVTRIINPGAAAHSLTYNTWTNSPCSRLKKPPISTTESKRLQFHVPSSGVDC